MIKHAADMTLPECALVVARHEYPDADMVHQGDGWIVFDRKSNADCKPIKIYIDDVTIGPLWRRDKAAVIDRLLQVAFTPLASFPYDVVLTWYKSATLEDLTRALIDLWFPDGVEI
jgi:hypothetical protein